MLKLLITDVRKEYLYGDCHLEEDGHWYPLIGGKIKVKILGLIWVDYKVFYYKNR